MHSGQAILVLETDAEVISDIQHSLRLLHIPVHVERSVSDAKRVMLEHRPCLVITRYHVTGEAEAGLKLARGVSAHETLRRIPLVLLLTAEESQTLNIPPGLFRGMLTLPVVFPHFTQHVQDLISQVIVEARKAGPAAIPAEASHVSDPRDRMAAVYKLQYEIIERLRGLPEFQGADPTEVRSLYFRAAQEVCSGHIAKKPG